MKFWNIRCAWSGVILTGMALLAGCERPPVEMVQHGYRGTGMDEVYNPRAVDAQLASNVLPPDTPQPPAGGPAASTVFKNLQVVGNLNVGEFTRLMASMTAWVAPQQGCTYCHKAGDDFSADSLYTKVVARRMLQMTRHINTDWKAHVAQTGVTCWTCHRGQPVPANLWYAPAPQRQAARMLGDRAGQNAPAPQVGLTSLPNDPFTPFLSVSNDIRVISTTALPAGDLKSIKQTEWTYGLMMHMSKALGVNCTYCHNTRSFAEWDGSTPQRATAWYGIRMVRDINTGYLNSLAGVFPQARLGPTGDVPKANCTTCHQGAFKPMYGASMLATHPELTGVSAVVGSAGPAAATPGVAVVFFAVGSSAMTDEGVKSLAPVIAALNANPEAKVTISGFHSAAGNLAQNQELAKQRAFSVRGAFKAAGIAADRVVLDKPQSAEANLSGEDPKSRRVEVAVRS
jgi:photosynthetic reaction center cytochrome c subunit